MWKKIIKLMVCVVISTITQFAFAEDTAPFSIGDPTVDGNGCPDGTYSVILSPDGTELSILFSDFTAETDEDHRYDFSNCNIAVPIEVPSGITVGLLGVDYRGIAFIPSGGLGMLTREYFFAGTRGPRKTSLINTYNEFYEFYYPDELVFAAWTECGDDIIARSNATVYVSRPFNSYDEALMSVFSEDWDVSIIFNLVWKYC
ncbi:MAG: DUF4360 domain-containing protein [Chitinivibrionales bacterium]|nr:DUF4360 domain-containing protein [Chitinivibrionales bacterium]